MDCQLSLDSYQEQTKKTAVYISATHDKIGRLSYCVLGLCGESGEVAEKVKKIIRNHQGELSEERKTELIKEVGDVLWYLAAIATELNVPLSVVAELNLAKLADRHKRNVIASEGDNR